MSAMERRRAFVICTIGGYFTGKTKLGKPVFSDKLSEADKYTYPRVAKHYLERVAVLGATNLSIREVALGRVIDV